MEGRDRDFPRVSESPADDVFVSPNEIEAVSVSDTVMVKDFCPVGLINDRDAVVVRDGLGVSESDIDRMAVRVGVGGGVWVAVGVMSAVGLAPVKLLVGPEPEADCDMVGDCDKRLGLVTLDVETLLDTEPLA